MGGLEHCTVGKEVMWYVNNMWSTFMSHAHTWYNWLPFILPSSLKDTAGEEKYASLSSFYCRGAHVAILAVDLTRKGSLERLEQTFIPLLEEQAPMCLTVVVGTKLDLVKSAGRELGSSEGKSLAIRQHQRQLERALRSNPNSFLTKVQGHESYFETSSKTGEGVTDLFQYIERIILIQLQKSGVTPACGPTSVEKARRGSKGRPDSTIRLDDPPPSNPEKQSGCCKNWLV